MSRMAINARLALCRNFFLLTVLCVLLSAPVSAFADNERQTNQRQQGQAGEQRTVYDDVVVTGTRSPHTLSDVPVDTVLISRDEIERSSANNLPQLLRSIPGMSVTNLDDTIGADNLRLTLRGLPLNDGYGLILVDGQRVHGGLGAHGDYGVSLNRIPLSMIERVEIVKGASSALYGADAMAGVINIITRSVPERRSGTVGADYGIYDVMPQKGSSVEESTRRRQQAYASFGSPVGQASGLLIQLAQEADEGTGRSPQQTTRDSAMARWSTGFGDNLRATLGGDFSRSLRETSRSVTDHRYDREIDEYRISTSLQYDSTIESWRLSGYTYKQDFIQGYPGFTHGYRFGDTGYDQAEAVYTWYGNNQWLTMGAEAQRQSLDYTIHNYADDGTLESEIDVDRNIDIYAVFLQDEIFLQNGRITLVPGIRWEDHSVFGSEFNPKLSAAIQSAEDVTWRMSVGRAFKSPTIRQLYYDDMYRHGNDVRQSNPDLSPERAVNYNISVERGFPDSGWWTSIGAFRTDLKDKVVRYDTGSIVTIGGDDYPVLSYRNIDEARIEGIELSFRNLRRVGFTLRGSAGWTRAEDRNTGKDLPFVPEYTASLVPGYVSATGRTGIESTLTAVGSQYRDTDNDDSIDSHYVVDIRIWRQLTDRMRASVDAGNIFESHRGEEEHAHRMGRSFGISIAGDL